MIAKPIPHFSSLVAFRFIAAASVVFGHTLGSMLLEKKYLDVWGFPSLMVFFHVLSGFTLAYIYPRLESPVAVGRFWMARIGRIWPVHVALLGVVILSWPSLHTFDGAWWGKLAMNVTLTQCWFPIGDAAIVFNGPAWSLSTEFGLYLLFPLLILRFDRTWHLKLIAAFCVAMGVVIYCAHCDVDPNSMLSQFKIFPKGLVYTHPLTRLFEFVLGMTLAHFWPQLHSRFRVGTVTGTMLESGVVLLCVAAMVGSPMLASALEQHFHIGRVWSAWLNRMLLPALPFTLLIAVFSLKQGRISALLDTPWIALLGELSFALYLVHMPLIHAFTDGVHDEFSYLPAWAVYTAFWICALLSAHIIYVLWEQPCRRWFRTLVPASKDARAPAVKAAWTPISRPLGIQMFVVLALLGLVLHDSFFHSHLRFIDERQVDALAEHGSVEIRNLRFGDLFLLKTLSHEWSGDNLKLNLVWQSLADQRLDFIHAVHFVDDKAALLGGADHPQDLNKCRIAAGKIWVETLMLSKKQMKNAVSLGLGIYPLGGELLQVSGGVRDWDNRRLLIHIGGKIGL